MTTNVSLPAGRKSRDITRLLRQAAYLRCKGWTWPQIAKEVNRSVRTVEGWPHTYREEFCGYMDEQENHVREELVQKAYGILEEMLSSEDSVQRDRAVFLVLTHADRRHAINSKRRLQIEQTVNANLSVEKRKTYVELVCERLGVEPPERRLSGER